MPNPNISVEIKYLYWDGPQYRPALRNAFEFFRRNSNGRYSDSTLVGITRAWDLAEANPEAQLPHIVIADAPFTYDPDTEVKTGGVLGMAIGWPEKVIMAVSRSTRREGIGTRMFNEMQHWFVGGTMSTWVGRSNTVGHHFCLSRGMIPTAMNGQGAVRYTIGEVADD